MLAESVGKYLLQRARNSLQEKFGENVSPLPVLHDERELSLPRAVFITLTLNRQLRGCIGNLEPVKPLLQAVLNNTSHAAFNDTRFSPLTANELQKIRIELSVLSEPVLLSFERPASLKDALCPGKDGVILREGRRQATFLPQVWEQLPDPEDFLNHLCLKAGLQKERWKEKRLDVYTYRVQKFKEREP